MASVFIIEIDGLKGVQKYLANLELTEERKRELLADIGTVVVFQAKERFKTKTAPEGKRWKGWSAKYRLKRASGKSLLEDEGHLKQSIVYKVSGNQLEVGSDEIYSGTHQYGHRNIPARPYLGINAEDEAEIEDEIIDYLKGQGY